MEVPLKTEKPPPGTDELMEEPGARSERKDAEFEKIEMPSDLVVDPTLMAVEIQAGAFRASLNPSLPAAATVAIPTERKLSIAAFLDVCWLSQGEVNSPPPRLMFTAAKVYWFLRAKTRSKAAI
jgi:hypothetical protein